MKNQKYIIGIVIGMAFMVALYFTYTYFSDEDTTEVVDEHADHADDQSNHHGHGKTVELNSSQYANAGIELGWFEKKNMSEVVHANGYTKLPPQNQADVSVFTTGLVKTIKVVEGQEVKKGAVLAYVESPAFTILQQEYLVSKSNLDFLKLEYDRQVTLSAENVNAKKVLEKTKAELEAEQARYNSLKKQLAVFKINGDGGTISTIPIVAPIGGHITEIYVNIGSSVEVGKPLFSIMDNSEMHVDLLVYEQDLPKVAEGQTVHFVLTNQSNKEIEGVVFNVGKSFENETKTVAVHAHIKNKDAALIPGMYVNALIDIGSNKVKTLPEGAVVQAEGRSFIFLYEKENDESHEGHSHGGDKTTFSRIEVKTGPSQLGYIQVAPLQKIHQGDKIVLSGAYYLQSHLQKSESGGEHSH
ncbi:MAG: cobalt-zinc-cadmium efflux system membrane fusion protein [Crocinitomix sp.]|jgi:cobalt-zinc-cadmium efflux system membrane fusion protein